MMLIIFYNKFVTTGGSGMPKRTNGCRLYITAVYGIDVNYGMLEVRPCAMLDMRLKQDSNEPV